MTFKKLFPFILIGSLLYALYALAADDRVLNSSVVQFSQIVTPANPPANKNKIYFKSDDKAYRLDSLGNEVELGAASVGGADTEIQFNNSGALDGDPDLIWDYTNSQLRTGSAPIGNTKLDFRNSGGSNAILMRLQDPGGSGDLLHVLDNSGSNLFKITNGIVAIGDPSVDFSVQYDATANHSFEFLQGGGGFFRLGSDIAGGEFHFDNWDGAQYETAISIEGVAGDVVINTNQDPVHNFIVKGGSDTNLITTDSPTDNVGIGTSTPTSKLDIQGTVDQVQLIVRSNVASQTTDIAQFYDQGGNITASLNFDGGMVLNQQNQPAGPGLQVKGLTDNNLIFTDSSTDHIGIGTATPAARVDLVGVQDELQLAIKSVTTGQTANLVQVYASDGTPIATMQPGGSWLLNQYNQASAIATFKVSGATDNNMLVADPDTDSVSIGRATPEAKLDLAGNFQIKPISGFGNTPTFKWIRSDASVDQQLIRFEDEGTTLIGYMGMLGTDNSHMNSLTTANDMMFLTSNWDIHFGTDDILAPAMTVYGINNFVGINKIDPAYRLDVDGNARISGIFYDTQGTPKKSIDPNNRKFYDVAEVESINYDSRNLIRSDAAIVVDWENEILKNTGGDTVLSWSDSTTLDTTGELSIDWEQRFLRSDSLTTSLDWASRQLLQDDGSTIAVDWDTGPLKLKQSIVESDADETTLKVKGDSGQTANYVQVSDSSDADVAHIDTSGNFKLVLDGGGLYLKKGGGAAVMGRDTLVAGTVTVSTTSIATSCEVFVTARGTSTLHGALSVENVVAGTSFDIVSTSITDDGDVSWMIVCDS